LFEVGIKSRPQQMPPTEFESRDHAAEDADARSVKHKGVFWGTRARLLRMRRKLERVTRKADPSLVEPKANAEPILTVTFAFELPWSLRIADVAFLVSEPGDGWPGWSADAMGALAGMPPLPQGRQPRYRAEMNQSRVCGSRPLAAAECSFPQWQGFPARDTDPNEEVKVLRSAVLLSIYCKAMDTPFADEEPQNAIIEWLSRRLDEALEFLNRYMVILGALDDEWHISSISRIDLQRRIPWELSIEPAPEGWHDPSGTLDAHVLWRDDLPEQRPLDEVMAAVELIHSYRAGKVPFFDWIELYQAAEHHLGSGRNSQAVIFSTTAVEVLVNTLFRVVWALLEKDEAELPGVLECGFKNQLKAHLPRLLNTKLDLSDTGSPPGRWHQDCYLLRNDIVHKGRKPSSPEAMDAKLATRAFADWIGANLMPDPRTDWIKAFLQAPKRS
jgi:hypothetical protein